MAVAKAYDSGTGVKPDRYEAAAWYQKAADLGNAEAQNSLGIKYRRGEGVPKDLDIAVRWYRLAAKNGYAEGMFNVGAAYYNGDGVKVDDSRSLSWFLCAVEFGSRSAPEAVTRAVTELPKFRTLQALQMAADMLTSGEMLPARPQGAVKLLQRAIAMGSKEATIKMANLYMNGTGVERNPQLAFKYCQDGASLKFAPAMTCLGQIYQAGLGVPIDVRGSMTWYQKGAECGEAGSMLRLAKIYLGLSDKQQAYTYFLLASPAFPEAKSAAESLKPELSKKDRERLERKVKDMRSKISSRQDGRCLFTD